MQPNLLLGKLPPYQNRSQLITRNQSVTDIITEVINAHKEFAAHYDRIANDFNSGNVRQIAKALFNFCKQNIRYRVEPERMQTTKSPAAIIALGNSVGGDCKHYAGFIAGVLDALKRKGRNIDWKYRFASYNYFDKLPQHVFVVVNDSGNELWIDPVLSSLDERLQPAYFIDKTVVMPLMRLSGLADDYPVDSSTLDERDMQLDPDLRSAIQLLYDYKIFDTQGRVSEDVLKSLSQSLPEDQFNLIADAFNIVRQRALGGFLDDLWNDVKIVTLAIPRTAYLQLVQINFNHMATNLYNVCYDEHNKLRPEYVDVKNKWESLGGSWPMLVVSFVTGSKLSAVLGSTRTIGNPAAAAWAVTAATIIVAMTPIINGLVNKLVAQKKTLALPSGSTNTPTGGTASSIMDWIKANPVIVAGGVLVGYYAFFNKKTQRRTRA